MTKSHTTITLYKDQQMWFFGLLSILIGLFMLYGYFLASSVFDVVVRKELEREIVHTSSYVSELETSYAQLQYTVNPEIAKENGYVAVRSKIFIDRADVSLAYSRNIGE